MDNPNDPNSSDPTSSAIDPNPLASTNGSMPSWSGPLQSGATAMEDKSSPSNTDWPTDFPTAPTDTSGLSSDPIPQPNPLPTPASFSDPTPPVPTTVPPATTPSASDPWLTPAEPTPSTSADTLSTLGTSSAINPTNKPASDLVSAGGPTAGFWDSPSQTAPTPTFTPPAPPSSPSQEEPILSPLDNPLGSPIQAPPIEQPQTGAQPSWTSISTEQLAPADQNSSPPPTPTEAAPTDLSHLISSNQSESASSPASETLFVPSNPSQAPEVPNLQTENHPPIPKWLIGLGGLLLIVVIGASAYFILGIGRNTETTSLPATTTSETTPAKPATAVSTSAAQTSTEPESANSGNFGEFQGSGSQGNQQATSAAELLRQRQQQGR